MVLGMTSWSYKTKVDVHIQRNSPISKYNTDRYIMEMIIIPKISSNIDVLMEGEDTI